MGVVKFFGGRVGVKGGVVNSARPACFVTRVKTGFSKDVRGTGRLVSTTGGTKTSYTGFRAFSAPHVISRNNFSRVRLGNIRNS